MMAPIIEFIKRKPLPVAIVLIVLIGIGAFAMKQAEAYPALACAPCHNMGPYVEGYESAELLSHKHEQASVKCIDCHDNSMGDKIHETWAYVTDDFDDPLDQHKFSNEMCLKCHNIDDIKGKTSYGQVNPHDSHLGDLVCSDCHKMHTKSKTACSECHNFEFMQKLPAEWEK